MSAPSWFYVSGGRRLGPVALEEVIGRIRQGAIPRDALVWHDGLADWVEADSLAEVVALLGPEAGAVRKVEAPPARPAESRTAVAGAFDPGLLYPNEKPLFVMGAIFSSLVWLALVLSIVGILYGLIGLAIALMAHALFLAHVKGNGVRVSPRQFPDLHARCQKAARALGLDEAPEIYLMQAGGTLNAFATKLLSRRFVIVFSDLADECQDPRQLDFVVGHEIGHLAAGHLRWNAFLWPFMLVPWLGPAYLRAREYTADRCGDAVVGDAEASMRGLVVLAAGGKHAAQADLRAFMDQRRETGSFWSAVLELVSSHPYLCKRVGALQEIHHPGTVEPVGRNPLAYPLAPFLGMLAGGPASGAAGLLVIVAIVGIVAAIAIPSLLRARVSANEAMAIGDIRTIVSAEAAYSSVTSGGFYTDLGCLAQPGQCLPNYQGLSFIDAGLASATAKGGYRRAFYPGAQGPGPHEYTGWAYTATPMAPGQTGVRSFCGDSSGIICAETGGTEILAQGGSCPAGCQPLP